MNFYWAVSAIQQQKKICFLGRREGEKGGEIFWVDVVCAEGVGLKKLSVAGRGINPGVNKGSLLLEDKVTGGID